MSDPIAPPPASMGASIGREPRRVRGMTWRQWVAVVALLSVVGWALGRCSGGADQEVMTETAKKACRRAVESTGVTGSFSLRVNEAESSEDSWVIAVDVATGVDLRGYRCDATRGAGDTVEAQVTRTR